VEVLDQFFGNVCELDLVFNFYKVRSTRRIHWKVTDEVLTLYSTRSTRYSTRSSWLERFKRHRNKLCLHDSSIWTSWSDGGRMADQGGHIQRRNMAQHAVTLRWQVAGHASPLS
jgi:hypothetical protein